MHAGAPAAGPGRRPAPRASLSGLRHHRPASIPGGVRGPVRPGGEDRRAGGRVRSHHDPAPAQLAALGAPAGAAAAQHRGHQPGGVDQEAVHPGLTPRRHSSRRRRLDPDPPGRGGPDRRRGIAHVSRLLPLRDLARPAGDLRVLPAAHQHRRHHEPDRRAPDPPGLPAHRVGSGPGVASDDPVGVAGPVRSRPHPDLRPRGARRAGAQSRRRDPGVDAHLAGQRGLGQRGGHGRLLLPAQPRRRPDGRGPRRRRRRRGPGGARLRRLRHRRRTHPGPVLGARPGDGGRPCHGLDDHAGG